MSEGKLVSFTKAAAPYSMEDFLREHDTLLKITKEALSTCLGGSHDQSCPPYPIDAAEFLPTRLVDLEAVERPRLIKTSESEIQDRRYVPLSHQWGMPDEAEKRAMTTTVSTLGSRMSGFELCTLPSRYQAVIMLCHAMDIRYIWIDSLCILQDSTEDWALQCPTMAKVYECGVFTICSNLPAGEKPYSTPDLFEWAIKLGKDAPNAPWLAEAVNEGPLSKRAWCLQERQLSPRILHVYHNLTWIWECNTRVRGCNQSGLIYRTDIVDSSLTWRKINFHRPPTDSQEGLLYFWHTIVMDYTGRKLTCATDRMCAISAVAQKLRPLLSLKYSFGLWESDIYGLMWHCDNFVRLEDSWWSSYTENLQPGSGDFLGPSWSWGSVDSPTYHLSTLTQTEKSLMPLWFRDGWRFDLYPIARDNVYLLAEDVATSTDSRLTQRERKIFLSCHSFRSPYAFRLVKPLFSIIVVSFDKTKLVLSSGPANNQGLLQDSSVPKYLSRKRTQRDHVFLILGSGYRPGYGGNDFVLFGLIVLPTAVFGMFVRIGIFKWYIKGGSGDTWASEENFQKEFGEKTEFTII